jgi:hypothetical protein
MIGNALDFWWRARSSSCTSSTATHRPGVAGEGGAGSDLHRAGRAGDTSGNVTKLARLETGLEIKVPLYIQEGEKVKVYTETREFAGRAYAPKDCDQAAVPDETTTLCRKMPLS